MARGAHFKNAGRVTAAFKKTADYRRFEHVGGGAFVHKLTGALAADAQSGLAGWPPLTKRYLARRRRSRVARGFYYFSGRFMRSIKNNPPKRAGVRRGIRFVVEYVKGWVRIKPQPRDRRAAIAANVNEGRRPLFRWNAAKDSPPIERELRARIQQAFDETFGAGGKR